MNKERENRIFRLTYLVYALATVIMILILIGFTVISREAVRSFLFLISYFLELILILTLALRKKIRGQKIGYIGYLLLTIVFFIFTVIYFFNKFGGIIEGFRKVIHG